MKTRIIQFCVITFIILFAFNATAQVKNNAIKYNLFGIIVSQYQMAYERAINENISAQLSAGLINRNWNTIDTDFGNYTSSGFLIIPEGRYYFKESLEGAYIGAFFRYRTNKWEYEDHLLTPPYNNSATNKRTSIGGGVILGGQILISDAMVMDIFIGPQFKSISSEFKWADEQNRYELFIFNDTKSEKSGIGIRFGFNFGVAF